MEHSKCLLYALAALTIGFVFCGQVSASFTVGGTTFLDTWTDDFDDGLTTGWSRARHTESGGEITINGGGGQYSTTENYSALFAGATEWAYKFRVYPDSNGTYAGNRTATLLNANDIRLQLYRSGSTTFQIWAGNGYYTSSSWYWQSGNYNFNQYYEIGVHKADGLNSYDIYVDGVQAATGLLSNTYDHVEVPTNILVGAESSIVEFRGPYDYVYVGLIPEPVTVSLLALGGLGLLLRRRWKR